MDHILERYISLEIVGLKIYKFRSACIVLHTELSKRHQAIKLSNHLNCLGPDLFSLVKMVKESA